MTQENNQPTLDQVIAWAKAAGKIALDGFLKDHKLGSKGSTDIVTEIDHQCEDLILGGIRNAFPGHAIFSEESGALAGETENTWYVDPLDGTVNYAHRIPLYVISIAYAHQGVLTLGVVYDPSRDECYSAERGKGAWLNGEPMRVSTSRDLHKSLLSTGFPYHDMSKFDENLRIFSRLTRGDTGGAPHGLRRARDVLCRPRTVRRLLGAGDQRLGHCRQLTDHPGSRGRRH